ncbi:MAG: potassium channel protein [Phycisphaerales bacterium]
MTVPSKLSILLPQKWDSIIVRSLLIACAVIAIGTAGYSWIEGWTLWQSLFFTLVTLTTVGYGDYGLSPQGERFTAILMVGGIATISFTFSQVLQRILTKISQPEVRMRELARQCQDHVVLCGLGRTGLRIADRLEESGVQIVGIDSDESRVENLRERGMIAITGDATSDETLERAGLANARAVAVATASDSANAMICLSARAIAPDTPIVARAEAESSICKLQRAGATEVLSPSSYGGDGIAQHILHPGVASIMPGLHENDAEGVMYVEYKVTETDLTIAKLGARHPRLIFIAHRTKDGGSVFRPEGSTQLQMGDSIMIAGARDEIYQLDYKGRLAA